MIQRGSLATIKSSESIPPDAEQDNRGMVIDHGSPSQHNRVRLSTRLSCLLPFSLFELAGMLLRSRK